MYYSINQIVMAVPHFFMGILLTYVFGLVLKWFHQVISYPMM